MFFLSTKDLDILKEIVLIIKNLQRKIKFQLKFLLIFILINSIFEMFSVAMIFPFLTALGNPNVLWENVYIQKISIFLGVKSSSELLFPITVLFIFISIFTALMRLFANWYRCNITALIACDLSYKTYYKSIYQDYFTHIQKNSSELISAITSHIGSTVTALNEMLKLITNMALAIGVFITLVLIKWQVACFSLILFCSAYVVIIKITAPILNKNSQIIKSQTEKRIKITQESLGSIKDIIINNNQKFYLNNYKIIDFQLRRLYTDNEFLGIFPKYIIESLGFLLIGVICLISINAENSLILFIPILGVFALGAQRLLPALQMIYSSLSLIRSYKYQISSILLIITQSFDRKFLISTQGKSIFKNNIVFDKVNFNYFKDQNFLINEFSFKINFGDTIGIIGETGSGKSTLVDLIMGLIRPSSGNIFIDGYDLYNGKDSEIHKNWLDSIAHVSQNIYLNDDTIASNIAFGIPKKDINYKRLDKICNLVLLDKFVKKSQFGLETIVGERGLKLSGGQKQRIGIARALYRGNKNLLVLDEATSALDNKTEELLIKNIYSLKKKYTLIMIAHRLSTLKNCNRIFKIDKGILKEISPNEL